MLKKFFFCTILTLYLSVPTYATLIRGADLTYSISGNNVTFNIVLYEEISGNTVDSIEISYGDGNTEVIGRINTITQGGIKYSNYQGIHTYPGNGTYNINVCDLNNRTSGITNITNSVNTPLSLNAIITLSSINIFSSSPLFGNDHFNKTISGDTVFHNTGTYDPDGDSLSFELINCLGTMCTSLSTPTEYTYPTTFGGGQTIDTSGILSYYVPISNSRFSFAIKVSKWRSGNLLCTAMRDILLENYWVGISETDENFMILNVFPNPVSQSATIFTDGLNYPVLLYVYDGFGKLIREESITGKEYTFNCGNLSSGIYFFRIGNMTKKIIIDNN